MEINITESGEFDLRKVFSGIGITTEEGLTFGVALRDNGLEIVLPNGGVVAIGPEGVE